MDPSSEATDADEAIHLEHVLDADDAPSASSVRETSMPSTVAATVTSPVSFEEFYARERAAIGRALAITLRDEALAADALDEAMARAYQRWDQVSRYGNPTGWVYRVGLNWARSVLRKITRPGRAPRAFELVSSAPTFDADIDRALRSLSVDQRAVVVCRFFIGYSEAETAEALGIRPGTVKSRLSRALEALRTSALITPASTPMPTREVTR